MVKINGASIIPLSESECNMLLDPSLVVWDKYHTSILESVSNRRATNERNLVIRSKKYIDDTENAADWMKRSYPESIANDERKTTFWTSCIVFLASKFKSALPLVSIGEQTACKNGSKKFWGGSHHGSCWIQSMQRRSTTSPASC